MTGEGQMTGQMTGLYLDHANSFGPAHKLLALCPHSVRSLCGRLLPERMGPSLDTTSCLLTL